MPLPVNRRGLICCLMGSHLGMEKILEPREILGNLKGTSTMRCEVIKFPTSKGRAIMFGDNPLLDDSPRPRGPTSLILISPMAESVKLR